MCLSVSVTVCTVLLFVFFYHGEENLIVEVGWGRGYIERVKVRWGGRERERGGGGGGGGLSYVVVPVQIRK